MTTIITRYFENGSRAKLVKEDLTYKHGLSNRIVRVIDDAGALDKMVSDGHMQAGTADAYKARMSNGGAVLVAYAGYKPLGVAKIVRSVTAQMGAVEMGDLTEEVKAKIDASAKLTILPDHSLMMSRPLGSNTTRFHMANWPFPLLTRSKRPFQMSIFPRHARMADFLLVC